jgi:hypothetical protein
MRLMWTMAVCAWSCSASSPTAAPSAPAPIGSAATVGAGSAVGTSAAGSGVQSADCAARATDLAAWLNTTARQNRKSSRSYAENVVEVADARPFEDALANQPPHYIRVSAKGELGVDGTTLGPTTPPSQVTEVLADKRAHGRTGDYLFVFDRDAPMARVAIAVAGVVAVGGRTGVFMVGVPKAERTPPPRSSVTDELLAPDPHGTRFVEIAHNVVAGCPRLAGAVADKRLFSDSIPEWIDGIKSSVIGCGCAVDLDALRATLWFFLSGNDPDRIGVVDAALAGPDDGRAITLSGATWADAVPAMLAAHGKPIRIPLAAGKAR